MRVALEAIGNPSEQKPTTMMKEEVHSDYPDDEVEQYDEEILGANKSFGGQFNDDNDSMIPVVTFDPPMATTKEAISSIPEEAEASDTAPSETSNSGDNPKNDAENSNKKDSSRFLLFFSMYVMVFLLVAIVVVLCLVFLTDVFSSETSSEAVTPNSGGVPVLKPSNGDSSVGKDDTMPFLGSVTLAPSAEDLTIRSVFGAFDSSETMDPTSSGSFSATTVPTSETSKVTQGKGAEVVFTIEDGDNETVLTNSPTLQPTTMVKTPFPTASPTKPPTTPRPTRPPTNRPTKAPTASPTMDITNTPLFAYLTTMGTSASTLKDPQTPQGKAFLWLMQPEVSQVSVSRIAQRYALVALDYALHENTSNPGGWQSLGDSASSKQSTVYISSWIKTDSDFCTWFGVTCDENEDVTELKWSRKGLAGELIPEIKLLKKLQKLDIAENDVRGSLEDVWDLPELTELYLFENQLYGTIPSDRGAPVNLKKFYAGHNNLQGPLPLSLLSSKEGPAALRYLILHHNKLTGTLPEGMRQRSLFNWDLSHNELFGELPSDFEEQLPVLRFLNLENNKFSGTISDTLPKLVGNGRLKQLYIGNNFFSGEFPSGWSAETMTNIDISMNSFSKSNKDICHIEVFEEGEMVEFRADCDVCDCKHTCHTCT